MTAALLARALHDATDREKRRDVATAAAAPARAVAAEGDEEDAFARDDLLSMRLPTLSLQECIDCAVADDTASALFLVDSAAYVAKRIRHTLDMDSDLHSGPRARDAILCRLLVQQTRDIHVLLSILHDLEHSDAISALAHVFVGPLCAFFTPFLTTNGLTTAGDGLLRMVLLACKRLRRVRRIRVTIIRDRPLLEL